ncbi:hypothetical protein BJ741DRAFT_653628 [Chytriomyces cf. hyalinus JEL632]|nr:hypothetical protein BJ741DRAFT_653628 [Chytriomyces cf. hyalinus JEL632]
MPFGLTAPEQGENDFSTLEGSDGTDEAACQGSHTEQTKLGDQTIPHTSQNNRAKFSQTRLCLQKISVSGFTKAPKNGIHTLLNTHKLTKTSHKTTLLQGFIRRTQSKELGKFEIRARFKSVGAEARGIAFPTQTKNYTKNDQCSKQMTQHSRFCCCLGQPMNVLVAAFIIAFIALRPKVSTGALAQLAQIAPAAEVSCQSLWRENHSQHPAVVKTVKVHPSLASASQTQTPEKANYKTCTTSLDKSDDDCEFQLAATTLEAQNPALCLSSSHGNLKLSNIHHAAPNLESNGKLAALIESELDKEAPVESQINSGRLPPPLLHLKPTVSIHTKIAVQQTAGDIRLLALTGNLPTGFKTISKQATTSAISSKTQQNEKKSPPWLPVAKAVHSQIQKSQLESKRGIWRVIPLFQECRLQCSWQT